MIENQNPCSFNQMTKIHQNSCKSDSFTDENKLTDVICQERRVLGDLTNCQKRQFKLISGDAAHGYGKNSKPRIESRELFNKETQGSQNGAKDSIPVLSEKFESLSGSSHLNIETHFQPLNMVDNNRSTPVDLAGVTNMTAATGGNSFLVDVAEGNVSRGSCVSSASVTDQHEETELSSPVRYLDDVNGASNRINVKNNGGTDPVSEEISSPVDRNDKEDMLDVTHRQCVPSSDSNVQFIGSQESAVNGSMNMAPEIANPPGISGSSCSRPFDVSLGKLHSDLIADGDTGSREWSGKDNVCSCDFCTKAAYVWSELHYEDAKGRLAEVKKSLEHARLLIGAHYNPVDSGESSTKSQRLESDLMHHWRALFLHTEEALGCECSQLQSSLIKLKELKESCKKDLKTSVVCHKWS